MIRRIDSATFNQLPAPIQDIVNEVAADLIRCGGYHANQLDARTDAVGIVLRAIDLIAEQLREITEQQGEKP